MRNGAIAALRWDELGFSNGFILLRGEVAKSGRTAKIPMSPPARAILKQIPRTDSPYLFPGKKKVTHRGTFRSITKRSKQSIELPEDFRCMHGLRHTFTSALASRGKVDLYALQKLLTYSSPYMAQRYSHLADEALLRVASVMGDIGVRQIKRGASDFIAGKRALQGERSLSMRSNVYISYRIKAASNSSVINMINVLGVSGYK